MSRTGWSTGTERSRRRARSILSAGVVGSLLGTILAVVVALPAFAVTSTLYQESFTNKQVTSPIAKPVRSGGVNAACLTASTDASQLPIKGCPLGNVDTGKGTTDANGSGALRLTSNSDGEVGGAFYSTSISTTSSSGLDLAFNVYTYRSATSAANAHSPGFKSPADGISFAMAAVDPAQPRAPRSLGPEGGNLGYNGSTNASPSGAGLSHGYLGIGFDTHGNFSNKSFNSTYCAGSEPAWSVPSGGNRLFPQAVTVRGPGNGTTGYCMLNSSLNSAQDNDPSGNAVANAGLPTTQFTDGVTTSGSPTLTSATANFTAADVGAPIIETDNQGAFAGGIPPLLTYATITAVVNATTVTLSENAAASATNVKFYLSRTRIYSSGTTRGAGTPVEIGVNPTASVQTTAGTPNLATVSVPARSYAVTFKPPGGTQMTLVGKLPTSGNGLLPTGAIDSSWIDPATGMPYQLSFGWTGATGSNNEIHEVNLTSASSLGGSPPVFNLTSTDRTAGNFNGNFSGDGPGSVVAGNIYFDGGLQASPAADEANAATLDITTAPGLPIRKAPSSATNEWTCSAASVMADYEDGVANGSTTFTSATAAFSSRDVGKPIKELDNQGVIPAGTTIASVTNSTTVVLSATATGSATKVQFAVGALTAKSDGVSTSGSATFTSASGAFTSADVGAVVSETDAKGAITDVTTIAAVVNGTTVTLSKPAASSQTAVAFNILRRSTSGAAAVAWSASCTHPGAAAGTSFERLGVPVLISDRTKITAPVASGLIYSLDGNPAYAADPGISTTPYTRAPTPVFTGDWPQYGPYTGAPGTSVNGNSNFNAFPLSGGNLEDITAISWGNATLPVCSGGSFTDCVQLNGATPAMAGTVYYPARSAAGSDTPDVTLTNAFGSTGAGRPFTYFPVPTLVTKQGPAAQSTVLGSKPAIITSTGATDLTNTTTVWWGDSFVDLLAPCALPLVAPVYNCFVVDNAHQLTVYPPGEVDDGSTGGPAVDFSVDPGTLPTQPAHSANVSLETTIGGTAIDFEDFGNYHYIPAPTATGLTPPQGPEAGGTEVTITGSGFTDPVDGTSTITKIEFDAGGGRPIIDVTATCGGVTNCFTVVDDTHVKVWTKASSIVNVPYTVRVHTAGLPPGATAPSPGTFTYVPSPTAVGSGTGPTVGGTTVTITGTHLDATTAVSFGGTALTLCPGPLTAGCYVIDSATQLRASSPSGSGVVSITVTASGLPIAAGTFTYADGFDLPPAPPETLRIGGVDRDDTAARVAEALFPSGGAPLVVIARDDLFADGLAGSPLAYGLGGPVLVTPTARLADSTDRAIRRVLAPNGTVIILGGVDAVAGGVQTELTGRGYHVERIGGQDRFVTASLVANRMSGAADVRKVFLATGIKFGDAISAAGLASANRGVVLLTAGEDMPTVTQQWMRAHGSTTVTAIGHPAAVAAPDAIPVVGADTFQTSTLAAQTAFPAPKGVVVATGTTFPDALAGAVYAAFKKLPQILINPAATQLDPTQAIYLTSAGGLTQIVALGGEAAVPERTVDLVRSSLTNRTVSTAGITRPAQSARVRSRS